MGATLLNVDLASNVWTDLYAATGLAVGTPIAVQNIGSCDVYLTVQAGQPDPDFDGYNVLIRGNGVQLRNSAGDPGAWAFSFNVGKVNVRPTA